MAIDSSLIRDFYVILDSGRGEDQIHVTFLDNPLVCWIWRGGGADWPGPLVGLWPSRSVSEISSPSPHARKMEIHNSALGPAAPNALQRRRNTALRNTREV